MRKVGRPRKVHANIVVDDEGLTPLDYVMQVMRCNSADPLRRDKMAIAALPFMHRKLEDAGKKVTKAKSAEKVAAGRFAPAPAPKHAVN